MAEIHGVVYIIIGVFFALSSRILDISREERKLTFFVFVGIIMILVGIFKLIVKGFKGSKTEKVVKKYCHKCGTALHSFQEFCHKCGSRISK